MKLLKVLLPVAACCAIGCGGGGGDVTFPENPAPLPPEDTVAGDGDAMSNADTPPPITPPSR